MNNNKKIDGYFIIGNWKMNKGGSDGIPLAEEIAKEMKFNSKVKVVICPPFTGLAEISKKLDKSDISLGAQNMHSEASGAFTGEISPEMLKSFYVKYVILGHSERRLYFSEDNQFINDKILSAFKHSIVPILCIGETLEERETNKTFDVIKNQLENCLAKTSIEQIKSLIIAYEPVWAIGTGKTATPEMAQEVHSFIRKWLINNFSEESESKVHILYGGSMKAENAKELLSQNDINGGLIGGASLQAKNFLSIVKSASELC